MKALFTSLWFPLLLAVIALFTAALILRKTVFIMKIRRINRMPRHGVDYIYALLRAYDKKHPIFKRLKLIGRDSMFNVGKNRNLIKRECDVAYIGRGGVLLLTVVPDTGCYDNPKVGNWKHSVSTENGQTITQTIVNPFDATNPHVSAIETVLNAEGITEKNITRAVVLTGKNVYYTTVYKEILSPGTLFGFLNRFNQARVLGGSEIKRIGDALRRIDAETEAEQTEKAGAAESRPRAGRSPKRF